MYTKNNRLTNVSGMVVFYRDGLDPLTNDDILDLQCPTMESMDELRDHQWIGIPLKQGTSYTWTSIACPLIALDDVLTTLPVKPNLITRIPKIKYAGLTWNFEQTTEIKAVQAFRSSLYAIVLNVMRDKGLNIHETLGVSRSNINFYDDRSPVSWTPNQFYSKAKNNLTDLRCTQSLHAITSAVLDATFGSSNDNVPFSVRLARDPLAILDVEADGWSGSTLASDSKGSGAPVLFDLDSGLYKISTRMTDDEKEAYRHAAFDLSKGLSAPIWRPSIGWLLSMLIFSSTTNGRLAGLRFLASSFRKYDEADKNGSPCSPLGYLVDRSGDYILEQPANDDLKILIYDRRDNKSSRYSLSNKKQFEVATSKNAAQEYVNVSCIQKYEYITQSSNMWSTPYIVVDLDTPDALPRLMSGAVPLPAFIVRRNSNGHCQAFWPLPPTLIPTSWSKGKPRAIDALRKIVTTLFTVLIGSDVNFSHHRNQNPYYEGVSIVDMDAEKTLIIPQGEVHQRSYSELADWLSARGAWMSDYDLENATRLHSASGLWASSIAKTITERGRSKSSDVIKPTDLVWFSSDGVAVYDFGGSGWLARMLAVEAAMVANGEYTAVLDRARADFNSAPWEDNATATNGKFSEETLEHYRGASIDVLMRFGEISKFDETTGKWSDPIEDTWFVDRLKGYIDDENRVVHGVQELRSNGLWIGRGEMSAVMTAACLACRLGEVRKRGPSKWDVVRYRDSETGEVKVNGLLTDMRSGANSAKLQELRAIEHGDMIEEGERNATLFRYALCLIWTGMTEYRELLDTVLGLNRNKCKKPLSEREVKRIVKSVMKYYKKNFKKEKAGVAVDGKASSRRKILSEWGKNGASRNSERQKAARSSFLAKGKDLAKESRASNTRLLIDSFAAHPDMKLADRLVEVKLSRSTYYRILPTLPGIVMDVLKSANGLTSVVMKSKKIPFYSASLYQDSTNVFTTDFLYARDVMGMDPVDILKTCGIDASVFKTSPRTAAEQMQDKNIPNAPHDGNAFWKRTGEWKRRDLIKKGHANTFDDYRRAKNALNSLIKFSGRLSDSVDTPKNIASLFFYDSKTSQAEFEKLDYGGFDPMLPGRIIDIESSSQFVDSLEDDSFFPKYAETLGFDAKGGFWHGHIDSTESVWHNAAGLTDATVEYLRNSTLPKHARWLAAHDSWVKKSEGLEPEEFKPELFRGSTPNSLFALHDNVYDSNGMPLIKPSGWSQPDREFTLDGYEFDKNDPIVHNYKISHPFGTNRAVFGDDPVVYDVRNPWMLRLNVYAQLFSMIERNDARKSPGYYFNVIKALGKKTGYTVLYNDINLVVRYDEEIGMTYLQVYEVKYSEKGELIWNRRTLRAQFFERLIRTYAGLDDPYKCMSDNSAREQKKKDIVPVSKRGGIPLAARSNSILDEFMESIGADDVWGMKESTSEYRMSSAMPPMGTMDSDYKKFEDRNDGTSKDVFSKIDVQKWLSLPNNKFLFTDFDESKTAWEPDTEYVPNSDLIDWSKFEWAELLETAPYVVRHFSR